MTQKCWGFKELSLLCQLLISKIILHYSKSWFGRNSLASLFLYTLPHRLLHFSLTVRRVREAGTEASVCFTLLLSFQPPPPPFFFFRNAPWVLFVNHPATDTSLCLHLFTASGNVAPSLFWRGLAASYLTDLPMKSQTHSMGLQCYT